MSSRRKEKIDDKSKIKFLFPPILSRQLNRRGPNRIFANSNLLKTTNVESYTKRSAQTQPTEWKFTETESREMHGTTNWTERPEHSEWANERASEHEMRLYFQFLIFHYPSAFLWVSIANGCWCRTGLRVPVCHLCVSQCAAPLSMVGSYVRSSCINCVCVSYSHFIWRCEMCCAIAPCWVYIWSSEKREMNSHPAAVASAAGSRQQHPCSHCKSGKLNTDQFVWFGSHTIRSRILWWCCEPELHCLVVLLLCAGVYGLSHNQTHTHTKCNMRREHVVL